MSQKLFIKGKYGIETIFFLEMGNTFDDYKDILRKKVLGGIGVGLRFFSHDNEPFTLFVSYNQQREIRCGIINNENF